MKHRWLTSLVVGFVASLYFVIVLPLQSFLPNADMFGYPAKTLVAILLCVFFGVFPMAVFLLQILGRVCGQRIHCAVIVLMVIVLLESGPLSIGLPLLNGDFAGYQRVSRAIWDGAALLAVCVGACLFYPKLKKFIIWIALAFCIYSSAGLLDCKPKSARIQIEPGSLIEKTVPRNEVMLSAEFSCENNVIVLILDAVASYVVQDILRADTGLAGRFDGFVNFVNNVGMHNPTIVAIPGMMSGLHFESSSQLKEYGLKTFSADSFVQPYVINDIPVYLNVGPSKIGYTNRLRTDGVKVDYHVDNVLTEAMSGEFPMSIIGLTAFRAVPYCCKKFILRASLESERVDHRPGVKEKTPSGQDSVFWPFIARRPINPKIEKTLHVHHSYGGHVPIRFDENGQRVVLEKPKYKDYKGQCKYVLRCVADMFDVWRTNGLYAASTIIMVADHGPWFKRPDLDFSKIPPCAFPFLMVKPRGGDNPLYCENEAPTSHARIAPLIRELRDRDLTIEQIVQCLMSNNRFFRMAENGQIRDYIVNENMAVSVVTHEDSEPDPVSLVPLRLDETYSLQISSAFSYPPVSVENGRRTDTSGLTFANLNEDMVVRFRVPQGDGRYSVYVNAAMGPAKDDRDGVSIRIDGQDATAVGKRGDYSRQDVIFRNVVADANGVVAIRFQRWARSSLHFVLAALRISIEQSDGNSK